MAFDVRLLIFAWLSLSWSTVSARNGYRPSPSVTLRSGVIPLLLISQKVITMYKLHPAAHYRTQFDGSEALFSSCWRQYRRLLAGDIDNPRSDDDVFGWLEELAAARVNNAGSSFYTYG